MVRVRILIATFFNNDSYTELPTVFKRAVKSLKSVVDKCINVAQSMDNLPELNVRFFYNY